jgi:hypothetical protein
MALDCWASAFKPINALAKWLHILAKGIYWSATCDTFNSICSKHCQNQSEQGHVVRDSKDLTVRRMIDAILSGERVSQELVSLPNPGGQQATMGPTDDAACRATSRFRNIPPNRAHTSRLGGMFRSCDSNS